MTTFDFSDVRGQDAILPDVARAVGTRRNIALIGSPGAGRTMIARRLTTIMPALSDHERRWLVAEYTAMGLAHAKDAPPDQRPFRAPHYTASEGAIVGFASPSGGHRVGCGVTGLLSRCTCPKDDRRTMPGEVRLGRFGVLLLDEVMEFRLATLRRLAAELRHMGGTGPLIVITEKPCPCGWHLATSGPACTCAPASIVRWQERLEQVMVILGIMATFMVGAATGRGTLADYRDSPPSAYTSASLAELAAAAAGGVS